jgi:hypothetical protein
MMLESMTIARAVTMKLAIQEMKKTKSFVKNTLPKKNY